MEVSCFLYRLAAAASRSLPVDAAYALAHRIADICRYSDIQGREGVRCNLERILRYRGEPADPMTLRLGVRNTYRHFGAYLVDFFRYSSENLHGLDRRVDVRGREHIPAALARGKGGIFVTAHLGSWELGGLVMERLGYPLTVVYKPYANVRLDRFFWRHRAGRGVRLLPLGRAMTGLLRTLRAGELVALLADRDFTRNHMRVSFFGAPACMPAGAVRLSVHTGAPLIPAFLTRRDDGDYQLRFDEPIAPADFASDPESMQERITLAMERAVGDDPDQWFVFRDFWKTDPQGGKSSGVAPVDTGARDGKGCQASEDACLP